MSKRRLLRYGLGVLATLMLLASLVPTAQAQLPIGPTGVQGVAVDANTREPLVGAVNVIVGVTPAAVVGCPVGIVPVNPVQDPTQLPTAIQNSLANVFNVPVGALVTSGVLRCTSVTDQQGRWGFTIPAAAAPPGNIYNHYAFANNYQPLSGQFSAINGQIVQRDYALSLTVTGAGGIPGATAGTIRGTVTFATFTAPAGLAPAQATMVTNAQGEFQLPLLPVPGFVPPASGKLESLQGTLVVATQITGPAPGIVVVGTANPDGSFSLTVPAAGVAGTWRVIAIDPGGNNNGPNQQSTGPFCVNGQVCGHRPSAAQTTGAVGPGTTVTLGSPLAMPLKTAPPSNPAGFVPPTVNQPGSQQNDIGAFGYVIDITTGNPVNGVTVTATCTAGNCANNITAVTSNNPNSGGAGGDAGAPGYFAMGGLTRGVPYTFRVTAVPAGFRIVDSCQVTEVTPPAPVAGTNSPSDPGTWMDPNLCVQSLGVLTPIPGAAVLAGRVVDPIQLTAGAPTPLGGVTIVAVRIDGALIGSFANPFTGFVEAAPVTQTDAGGNWVLAGVPPGTYRITALDTADVLCAPAGTAPAIQLTIPGGISRPAQTGGCGHIPASQPPAGQPGILAQPDAVTVVPDIVMPPKPAPSADTLATPGGVGILPPTPVALAASATTGGGIFGYVWDGVLGQPAQGATVQVRAVTTLGPEVLSGAIQVTQQLILAPQVLPGVAGSPALSALTSFSGRYEIPGLQPGTAYVVTVTGGVSVPRVQKTVTIVAGQWKSGADFALINTGLIGLPGGPAGGRLELVFPLVSRGGNADIYGVPIETTRIKIQNTGSVRTLASIFWCSSTFAIGGVGTADCGAGDSIDLNPAASVAIAPPAGFFGAALVFTSAPPIGPAPGQAPPGAFSLANLEGIAEYLVGDHQSFTVMPGIPAEELAQAFATPGNASAIGMAFKNWNPATEWNTVVSAMNITNTPQPIVFTLMPTRGVPGGPVQVVRTAPAFGVAILDLRTVPDIAPRWMGSVYVASSGGIPPIAQLPGSQVPSTAGVQGTISSFITGNAPIQVTIPNTANSPLQYIIPGGARGALFVPGGIASAAINYTNRAQLATALPGIYNSSLYFNQVNTGASTQTPAGTPFAAGYQAIGQIVVLPLVYNGFDGWSTGIQVSNPGVGGATSYSLEFFNENGQQVETIQDRVGALAGVTYFTAARNAPDYKVGSVRIRATDGAAPFQVAVQMVNYARGMAIAYNGFNSLNTSVINVATGGQDVTPALGNETCVGINQPATFISGQPLQLPVAQCLYVPSVRKDVSIDPDTGRVRLGWTSGIRVLNGDDLNPIPSWLTIRYFDPSGFEWTIAREAFVISSPWMAHTTFLGNTASLPTGFDGSAIITATNPRVFGVATVIDYARPSAVPGQPPAGRAAGWNIANSSGFIN
jgi:hypothetical protein